MMMHYVVWKWSMKMKGNDENETDNIKMIVMMVVMA